MVVDANGNELFIGARVACRLDGSYEVMAFTEGGRVIIAKRRVLNDGLGGWEVMRENPRSVSSSEIYKSGAETR